MARDHYRCLPTTAMASNFRIEPVKEEDMPRCMEICLPAFDFVPIQSIIAGPDTPDKYNVNAQRHIQGLREHAAKYPSVPPGIKCIYTDPVTGDEKIVGFAEWLIWDRERTEEEYSQENYILRLEWVESNKDRDHALSFMQPFFEERRRAMKGRPFGLLIYMCVEPEFRRQGVASQCVRWGMERCAELGIPAYLEASEEGMPLYKRLGWELMEGVSDLAGELPPMIWYPPNVKKE